MTKREKEIISRCLLNSVVFADIRRHALDNWSENSQCSIDVAKKALNDSAKELKALGITVPSSWDWSEEKT